MTISSSQGQEAGRPDIIGTLEVSLTGENLARYQDLVLKSPRRSRRVSHFPGLPMFSVHIQFHRPEDKAEYAPIIKALAGPVKDPEDHFASVLKDITSFPKQWALTSQGLFVPVNQKPNQFGGYLSSSKDREFFDALVKSFPLGVIGADVMGILEVGEKGCQRKTATQYDGKDIVLDVNYENPTICFI